MIYYNQTNYPNVPYPAPGYEKATVKTSGCGVCCGSMIVENLTKYKKTPDKMAEYCINIGARVSGGTNMTTLSKGMSKDFGINYKTSNNINDVVTTLKQGGMCIANVGGNRGGYKGIFSDAGHYIVLYNVNGSTLSIADPYMYNGKYNKSWRKPYVTVSGNFAYATTSIVDKDCSNRSPRYYLYTISNSDNTIDKEDEEVTLQEFKKLFMEMRKELQDNDAFDYSKDAREWAVNTGIVQGGSDGQFNGMWGDFMTREQFVTVLYRFAKTIGKA